MAYNKIFSHKKVKRYYQLDTHIRAGFGAFFALAVSSAFNIKDLSCFGEEELIS